MEFFYRSENDGKTTEKDRKICTGIAVCIIIIHEFINIKVREYDA